MHKLRYLDHVIQASGNVDIDPEDFLEAQLHFTAKCAREEGLTREERISKVWAMLEAANAYGEYETPLIEEELKAHGVEEQAAPVEAQPEEPPVQEEQPPQGIGRKLFEEMTKKFRGIVG